MLWLARAVAASICQLDSIAPAAGPLAGGTLVNLTGSGFEAGSKWHCSFGGVIVAAEYDDSAGWMSCYTPSSDDTSISSATVNASIDGGNSWCESRAGISFTTYPLPNVSAASPASGSVQGGTHVTLTGSGFNATGTAHCSFGALRLGDTLVAGALVAASQLAEGRLVCAAPSGDDAAAVGGALLDFDSSMPAAEVISPCAVESCVAGLEPARLHRFDSGHNLTLLGKAVVEARLLKLTRNRFHERGAAVLSLYNPGAPAGTPVRAFTASWVQMVGRGTGADGYSFVYGDLSAYLGADAEPFDEMGGGDGADRAIPHLRPLWGGAKRGAWGHPAAVQWHPGQRDLHG